MSSAIAMLLEEPLFTEFTIAVLINESTDLHCVAFAWRTWSRHSWPPLRGEADVYCCNITTGPIVLIVCPTSDSPYRFIGYFGNADPLDPSQWFHLSTPPTGAVWQWNDATSTCSSMITGTVFFIRFNPLNYILQQCIKQFWCRNLTIIGVNYKFLVGYTGEKSNPQSKIISATVDYTSEDVRTRCVVLFITPCERH